MQLAAGEKSAGYTCWSYQGIILGKLAPNWNMNAAREQQ